MSFENRIAIVSQDFAFANNLKEFLQKEKLINDVIVKGSFSDAFFESLADLTILDYETFELEWHSQTPFSNQFHHGKFLFLFSSADIDNQTSTSPLLFYDDFLIKPINYRELLLRIKQLLTHEEREDMLWYGNTLLHFSLGTLTTPKGTIDLTSYESKILHTFFEQPQHIISRAELLNINNAENYDVSDRSIDVRISIIRKKLIAISSNLSLLSRRGCGYILTISS